MTGRMLVAAALLVSVAACGKGADTALESRPTVSESTVATDEPSPTPTPTPEALEPCDLLTRKQVETIAGTPVDKPVESPEACMWTAPVTGPTAQVEVYVGAGAKKILDVDRDLKHELAPLRRIGEEAYVEEGAVFFSKADQWIAIRVVRLDDFALYRRALVGVARAVAERI